MNIQKITNIVSWTLGLLGLLFLFNAMQGSYGFVSYMIWLAIIVLSVVTLSTLIFSLKNIASDKSKLKKFGMSIGSFLLVIVIAFVFSSGVETPMGDGKMLSATGSRLVVTGIKTFYFLVLIAGGLMVYNSVSKLFKK